MRNLVLIGMPATFKSSAGKLVAKSLNLKFVDVDTLIEENEGMSVSEIFAQHGEEYFRALENKAAHTLSKEENQLIATGGGFVLNPDNMQVLKKNGVVCWLDASISVICERVTLNPLKRPLLNVADQKQRLEEILKIRRPLYRKYSEIKINTSFLTSTEVAKTICQRAENLLKEGTLK